MAEEKKLTEQRGVSPRGSFRFPHLVEPDYGTDAFPNPDGEFNTRLVVDEETKDAFMEKLSPIIERAEEVAEEEFKKLKPAARKKLGEVSWNDLAEPLFDDETEEPTGEYAFRFATKASGKNKKTGKPWKRTLPLFDAKRKPLKVTSLWGGTEGKLSFNARPYFVAGTGVAGVKLYLEAAQILDLVQGGERSASGYGFDEEEGFEKEEAPEDAFDDEDEGSDADEEAEEDDENEDF